MSECNFKKLPKSVSNTGNPYHVACLHANNRNCIHIKVNIQYRAITRNILASVPQDLSLQSWNDIILY